MFDMTLHVSIKKRLKYFDLAVDLTCTDGELVALIGPSGSGKTTLVRLIAGLDRPDEGRIVYDGETWFDSARDIDLPPRLRRLGYVFQDYTLFPHLNLRENVFFAARDRRAAEDLLSTFGIAHLAGRKPASVSGGERQRCAICQALAREPRVLLLDEPFSALDFATRRKLGKELQSLKERAAFPMIYVTHDIQEAFTLADGIISIVDGRIDKEWLQRTLASVHDDCPRAARVERLSLAF
jgi:molybdate transport system ATP-binding protein